MFKPETLEVFLSAAQIPEYRPRVDEEVGSFRIGAEGLESGTSTIVELRVLSF